MNTRKIIPETVELVILISITSEWIALSLIAIRYLALLLMLATPLVRELTDFLRVYYEHKGGSR